MRLDSAARIAAIYAAVSLVYIVFSDWLVGQLVEDVRSNLVQTTKGSGFVLVSAALIYFLIRAENRRQERLRKVATQSQRLEAIGQLTTVMAHDFNNLLTVIVGSLELIEDDIAPEDPVLRHVAMAGRAAANGGKLTRQMLVFAHQGRVQARPVCVNDSARQMVPLLTLATGEKVSVRPDLTEGLPTVDAEPSQFEKILLNLIINSRDAMPEGGEIRISTDQKTLPEPLSEGPWTVPAGTYVVVSVRDSGHGISKHEMTRVLEPFFTTKPVGKGTGLGLTMMRENMDAWSGHAVISSARGVGTTVSMYLPPSGALAGVRDDPAEAESESAPVGERTILLVENDEDVRKLVADQLLRLGHKVLRASGAAEATKHLEAPNQVDLLLSDIVLDGKMTGVALAKQARARKPELKVMLMSGYADPILTAEMAGFAELGWLPKPFDRAELQRELNRLLYLGSR